MQTRNFRAMLEKKWDAGKFVCVGLDPDLTKIPEVVVEICRMQRPFSMTLDPSVVSVFCEEIVTKTKDLVCAYKPNAAFFEGITGGDKALLHVIQYIKEEAPDVPIIYDAKRADIGNTNNGYVKSAFEIFGADAITVNPYFGQEAVQPFLDQKDKGIIVLCRTSNKGAAEFQDRTVFIEEEEADKMPVELSEKTTSPTSFRVQKYLTSSYLLTAVRVSRYWNINNNCSLVVGATHPGELKNVRRIVGDMPILIPGVGAQGGYIEQAVMAGQDERGRCMIINLSRSVLYASKGEDFADAARAEVLRVSEEINKFRKKGNG